MWDLIRSRSCRIKAFQTHLNRMRDLVGINRAKGTVKWFIDDLFVHQSGIRSECSRSFSEGETVESGSAAILSLLMLTGPDGATASGGSVTTT
ncbi:hypothetical protein RDI58_012522 [Solanum bulbocastanum]|uniref:Uncharacterized protein n=1 Tax=Solanum bulbocastanum TaxID=147425 RepID=A0AAN8YD61_SOLBU